MASHQRAVDEVSEDTITYATIAAVRSSCWTCHDKRKLDLGAVNTMNPWMI